MAELFFDLRALYMSSPRNWSIGVVPTQQAHLSFFPRRGTHVFVRIMDDLSVSKYTLSVF